ncbi:MAG: hypothetical protein N2558_01310 [Patescibacteria group bacterium]|nr:hypothetical protein [Patescibacteria group bacterium]
MYFALEIFFFLFLSLVGIFFLWRRLREDLSENLIFSLGLSIFGLTSLFLIPSYFYKDAIFWFVLLGLGVSVYIQSKKKKVKFFEIVDVLTISCLWCFFARAAILLGFKRDFAELINFCSVVSLIFLYHFVFRSYKQFVWYKSGRIGIAGVITLFAFFLGRFLVGVFLPDVLSLNSRLEMSFSLLFLFLVLFGFYKLNKI